jgi:hypothetical protein
MAGTVVSVPSTVATPGTEGTWQPSPTTPNRPTAPPERAADLLVRCLEAEGVRWIFGIPGEETLDVSDALDASTTEFVPVRHEQAGAFMADVQGRLTGRASVSARSARERRTW